MKNSPQETNIQMENEKSEEKSEPFIMLPTVDFCFKELMCSEKARKGLIAAFLNLDPREIQETLLLNTNLRKESETEKLVPPGANTPLYSACYPRQLHVCESSRSPLRRQFTDAHLTQISDTIYRRIYAGRH